MRGALSILVALNASLAAASSKNLAATYDHERAVLIDRINSVPGILWRAGVNERFRGHPLSVKSLCGVKNESAALVKRHAVVVGRTPGFRVADEFDSATNWPQCAKIISDIRDQSNCGCCWAFGAAEAASDRLCIATNGSTMLPLSAQNLCFCASQNGCNGGDLFTPWSYLSSSGIVTGGQFNNTGPFGGGFCSDFTMPHCHHHGPAGHGGDPYPSENTPGCPPQKSAQCPSRCDGDAASPHADFGSDKYSFDGLVTTYRDAESIQEAIQKSGPVETAFIVYEDFANYVGGIYHHVTGGMEGGHAVKIVGWGTENGTAYWKIANSWNKYWGEHGYFRMKRGGNECNVEGQVTSNMAGATWKHNGEPI